MKLYEIKAELEELVEKALIDEETGEILDIDGLNRLDELEMAFDEKVGNLACLIKNKKAEAEAIKAEKMMLEKRQKVTEHEVDRLKDYLAKMLNGEKFKDSRCSISYRRSEKVTFADDFLVDSLPDYMKKITVEPRKTEIKEFLKAGGEIEGVRMEESTSMQIR